MSLHKGKGVVSHTNQNPQIDNLDISYENLNLTPRPTKLQKTQIPSLNIPNHYYLPQQPFGGDPSTSNLNNSEIPQPEVEIIQLAEKSINDFQLANLRSQDTTHVHPRLESSPNRSSLPSWTKPEAGSVKANCDASLSSPGRWGLGCIIRDHQGLVLAAATWNVQGYDDVLIAEAYGLLLTVRFAMECGFWSVVFEGDNETLFKSVNKKPIQNRSYLGSILKEI